MHSKRSNRLTAPTLSAAFVLCGFNTAGCTSRGDAQAPAPQISVGENIRVNTELRDRPYVEPHLSAHPTNPALLLGASMVFNELGGAGPSVVAFISSDAGQSWRQQTLPISTNDAPVFSFDPWTAFGPSGQMYVSLLPRVRLPDGQRFSIWIYRSFDGASWIGPESVPFGYGFSFDHPVMEVDRTGGEYDGRIYVFATQGGRDRDGRDLTALSVARSNDGGRTFSTPVMLERTAADKHNGTLAILSDGQILAAFHGRAGGTPGQFGIWLIRSMDGGRSFAPATLALEVSPRAFHSLAAHSSSTRRDQLYLVWRGIGSDGNIYVASSSDRGETWLPPVAVNDDAGSQFVRSPMVAVNRSGVVGIAWYDGRNDPTGRCYEIFFTASLDSGRSFLPNVQVSSVPSCPDVPGNRISSSVVSNLARRWPAGGDYNGLAAAADDSFHVMWADSRTGVYQIFSAKVQVARDRPRRQR